MSKPKDQADAAKPEPKADAPQEQDNAQSQDDAKPDAGDAADQPDPRADDDAPRSAREQSNDAAQPSTFEPSKEEFVEYLRGEEVQSLAAKFGLVVTVEEAAPGKADPKKWPSWRYKDGSAKTGKLFNRPEDVPAGWTDKITKE